MVNAEQLDELTPEQYGSRKGKVAGIQCKRIFYDYIQAMRIPELCVQRILKASRQDHPHYSCPMALPLRCTMKATESISMLPQLCHHICLAFGNVNSKMTGQMQSVELARAMAWDLRSGQQLACPCLILQEEGFMTTFIYTLSLQHRQIASFAFIDDTDLIVTDDANDKWVVATKMQNSI